MGAAAIIAGITLVLGAGLLIVFFATENATADRASNWFFAAFYAAMAWTVVDVNRLYAPDVPVMWVATVITLVVLAFLFVTALLFVLGRLDFTKVAIPVTLGFVVVLLWMLAASVVIVVQGVLPVALGWFGVAVIAVAIVAVALSATDREVLTGEKVPAPGITALFGVVLVGLAAWLVWLGVAL
jgi:hypothetical protein